MNVVIRAVEPQDLEAVTRVEAGCFPVLEAAGRETLEKRIETFGDSFFVALAGGEEDAGEAGVSAGTIVGFINGCVTDEETIRDAMYEDVGLHNPEGAYQSVFGLDVLPAYRKRGIAAVLMNHLIGDACRRGKKGLILTCKDKLLPYYENFGYVNLGVSASTHGGAIWYDMILEFSTPAGK